MDIAIRNLSPELAEDYVHFFDVTPHDADIAAHKCYCVCWCSANHRDGKDDHSSREKRRALAAQYIKSEKIQGYLAYLDGRIVGWCNSNTKSDCQNCVGWLRNMKAVDDVGLDLSAKVKSVFCFVVAPEMKRKGIARRLLEKVCEDAASDGFDYVEAYPEKDTADELSHFMGFASLYEELGFYAAAETDQKLIMRKKLK